jgi:hypothetical protein
MVLIPSTRCDAQNLLQGMSLRHFPDIFLKTGTLKETSGPLVIPLITKNKWREADKAKLEKKDKKKEEPASEKDHKDLTIQERAAREILEESRKVCT